MMEVTECPECGGPIVDGTNGDVHCVECGLAWDETDEDDEIDDYEDPFGIDDFGADDELVIDEVDQEEFD